MWLVLLGVIVVVATVLIQGLPFNPRAALHA